MQTACPPRDVRSFRVIAVEDSQTYRRPANRYVQLTVWDILSLTLSEGVKPGAIEIGSRFMVRSLFTVAHILTLTFILDYQLDASTARFMDGQ